MKTKIEQNNGVHPQTVEIPQPLEVHPSVEPEFARGLLSAIDYLAHNENAYRFTTQELAEGKGCMVCWAEKFSKWVRPEDGGPPRFPIGNWKRVFLNCNKDGSIPSHATREFGHPSILANIIARSDHFLRTGL